jgi:hypothetical protein
VRTISAVHPPSAPALAPLNRRHWFAKGRVQSSDRAENGKAGDLDRLSGGAMMQPITNDRHCLAPRHDYPFDRLRQGKLLGITKRGNSYLRTLLY